MIARLGEEKQRREQGKKGKDDAERGMEWRT